MNKPGGGNRKVAIVVTAAIAVVVLVFILWPRQKEEAVQATRADCQRQLEMLRAGIREYVAKNNAAPPELFDPRKTVGVPKEYQCPVSGWNYSYNPKQWPSQWVICTYGDHRKY